MPAVGLTPSGTELVRFDTTTPGTIAERHAITGLKPTEMILGLDVRPATGQLYGLGIVRTAFDEGRVYVIDPGTGAATAAGPSPFKSGMPASDWGIDFNPSTDSIRIVGTGQTNLRVSPQDGTLIAQDANLSTGGIDAIAHDQDVAGTPQTTLWAYNRLLDKVVRIGGVNGGPPENSPNNGTVAAPFAAGSGISAGGRRTEMDIAPGGAAFLSA